MSQPTSLPLFQIDAFTDELFRGNPAAVCPLEEWIPDQLMQKIAAENNLAETAFFVKLGDQYQLRWFTPNTEVDLCGHATLASAYVLFNYLNHTGDRIDFHSPRSGPLSVTRDGELLTLNFPADKLEQVELSDELISCFDLKPMRAFKGKTDFLLVYHSEADIRNITPYFDKINGLDARGVIVTAPGEKVDFVSRFFAPQCAVPEDPVTGSAHTSLTPYWVNKFGKNPLTAMQLSERQGSLKCELLGDRVAISGKAKPYLIGEIFLE